MAIDTAAKRKSSLNWGMPWREPPRPTGTIDAAQRQSSGFVYSGIAAGAAVLPTFQVAIDLPARGNRIDLPTRKTRIDLRSR